MSDSTVSSSAPTMNIEIRDISTIRPYEKNPRLNDKAVDAVNRKSQTLNDCEITFVVPMSGTAILRF